MAAEFSAELDGHIGADDDEVHPYATMTTQEVLHDILVRVMAACMTLCPNVYNTIMPDVVEARMYKHLPYDFLEIVAELAAVPPGHSRPALHGGRLFRVGARANEHEPPSVFPGGSEFQPGAGADATESSESDADSDGWMDTGELYYD